MASVSAEWDVKFANQQQEMPSMKQTLGSIENVLKRESDSLFRHLGRNAHGEFRHIVRNATRLTNTRVKVNGARTKLFQTEAIVTITIVCRYITTENLFLSSSVALCRAVP